MMAVTFNGRVIEIDEGALLMSAKNDPTNFDYDQSLIASLIDRDGIQCSIVGMEVIDDQNLRLHASSGSHVLHVGEFGEMFLVEGEPEPEPDVTGEEE
jgi:hypothetical protein